MGFEYGTARGAGRRSCCGRRSSGLRQLLPGDRRPVHRLRPGQVGQTARLTPAAAAAMRVPAPSTQPAPGALPPRAPPRQHPRCQPDDACAILPLLRRLCAHRQSTPAYRDDAEVALLRPAAGDNNLATSPRTRACHLPHAGRAGVNDAHVRACCGAPGKIYYDLVGHPDLSRTPAWRRVAWSCFTLAPEGQSCS